MPARKPRLSVAASIGLSLVLVAACGKPPGQGGRPPGGPPEVGFIVVAPTNTTFQTELPGRTQAVETSEVRPQVGGIIQRRLFTEGGRVRAGQPLYQIDAAPYRAVLSQAEGQLAGAQANAATTRLKAERYADLVKINAVSRQEADDAQAAYQQAEASVQQARAAVQTARINVNYTTVKAPISGQIGRSTVTPGALVTASQAAAMATIQRTDVMNVDIAQSANELLALKRAMQSGRIAPAGVAVRLKLDDGGDYPVTGRLQFSEVTVDPSTGAVALRAVFPNPQGLLLPGMFVRAVISQGVQDQAIVAPQQGVSRDDRGQPTALVVNARNQAELRALTLTRPTATGWIVASGLKPGDRLIVEGVQKAKPGQPVRPVPAGSASRDGPPNLGPAR